MDRIETPMKTPWGRKIYRKNTRVSEAHTHTHQMARKTRTNLYSHSHKSRSLTWTDNDDVTTIESIFYLLFSFRCRSLFAAAHSLLWCVSCGSHRTRIPSSPGYLPTSRTRSRASRYQMDFCYRFLFSIFVSSLATEVDLCVAFTMRALLRLSRLVCQLKPNRPAIKTYH